MLVTFLNEDMYSELSLHFCEYTTSLDTDSARVKVTSPRPRSRSSRATTRRGAAQDDARAHGDARLLSTPFFPLQIGALAPTSDKPKCESGRGGRGQWRMEDVAIKVSSLMMSLQIWPRLG